MAKPAHKVKLAMTVGGKRGPMFVVDCECGWGSALCVSTEAANRAYATHKAEGKEVKPSKTRELFE